jgi:hypothetical protein
LVQFIHTCTHYVIRRTSLHIVSIVVDQY